MTKKLTYEYIKSYFESFGYKLLSKEYKNCMSLLSVKCNKDHEYKVTWNNFNTGKRCPICNGGIKLSYKQVKIYIESFGYKLLSKEYKNNMSLLSVKCNKNHEYKVTYGNFQQGYRCPICNGNKLHTFNYIKNQIEISGYTLLSNNYINAHSKLKIKCDKEHEYKTTWNNFQRKRRCPVCKNESTSSKAEKQIQNYISKNFNIKQINNDRNIIINPLTKNYLELDIYLPDLNKAIEYNGTYWHSLPDQKIKDKIKIKECKRLGIDLLIIEEKKFLINKNEVLKEIKQFLEN